MAHTLSNVAYHGNMICSAPVCEGVLMAEPSSLESPSERLEWARERAGFSEKADFARAVGVNPTTYRAYELGQNGFAKHAALFARKLGVTAEWLLDGGTLGASKLSAQGEAPDLPPTIQSEDGSIALRRLDFRLSMGDGANLDDYFEETPFEFDAALLRSISPHTPANKLIMGEGIGDSMSPTITDSSLVIVDTNQTRLNAHDAIYAIALYGAGGIKRLRPIARDRVLVISDNPAIENQEVSTEDLRILGRVIWSARRH